MEFIQSNQDIISYITIEDITNTEILIESL